MRKKKVKRSALSIVLTISVLMTTISAIAAVGITESAKNGILENAADEKQIHERMDISEIRNEGGDPPELLSAASKLATEKQWYEYIKYSIEPVGQLMVSDSAMISFYDPYDYSNSLVMEIDDTVTDWSSSNSLSSTYTTTNTLTTGLTVSVNSSSSVTQQLGTDYSETKHTASGLSTINTNEVVKNTIDAYEVFDWGLSEDAKATISDTVAAEVGTEVSAKVGAEVGAEVPGIGGAKATTEAATSATAKAIVSATLEGSLSVGSTQHWTKYPQRIETTTDDTVTKNDFEESSSTEVFSKVADRLTTTTGSTRTTSQTWSTSDSTSITKVYNAAYFNASGSPLQWKIVKYTVQMPMYYKVRFLIDDEWITSETGYVLLTTLQGTCRSWMENNTAYYEHWGTGEPVTWNDFWGRFFTKEKLIEAYKTKLYPEQVRSVLVE